MAAVAGEPGKVAPSAFEGTTGVMIGSASDRPLIPPPVGHIIEADRFGTRAHFLLCPSQYSNSFVTSSVWHADLAQPRRSFGL